MGNQPLPQKGGGAPQFSVHVYRGQTTAWIKMPLGTDVGLGETAGWIKMALNMEVGLGPGHIVLDGDPAPFP